MQQLIDSPELARTLGTAGLDRVVRTFDWQLKMDRVVSIYRALTEKRESMLNIDEHVAIAMPVSER